MPFFATLLTNQAGDSARCPILELPPLNDYAGDRRFTTVLADPPWRFMNRTGKMAPEHQRLARYRTMDVLDIARLPVPEVVADKAHLDPGFNALLAEGLHVMESWGFTYKTNLVLVPKDGGPDGRGVGFDFRNVTELVSLRCPWEFPYAPTWPPPGKPFRHEKARALAKARRTYDLVEQCSSGPYLYSSPGNVRPGWAQWGDEAVGLDQAVA